MAKRKSKKTRRLKPPKKVYQPSRAKIRPFASKRQEILSRAREMPIVGCWCNDGWGETGITTVMLAREQDTSTVLYGLYLVDIWCLGVKNAMVRLNVSRASLRRHVERVFHGEQVPCEASLAHQLIYGAIDFARQYGFEPHEDFYRLGADKILAPRGTYPESHKITFGKDGKPFYVGGPHDSPQFVRHVLNTLERTAPGRYHYIVPLEDVGDGVVLDDID